MKNIILLLASLMLAFTVSAQVAAISGPSSFCTGTTATYTNTTSGGAWSSSNTAIAPIGSASGIATGVASGVVTLTYTVAGTGFATYQVTVNPYPGSIFGSQSVCVGSSAVLSNFNPGGTWSAASSIVSIATSGSTATVTGVSAGTTTISYTNTFGCFSIAPMTVNAVPSAISGPSTMCGSTSITLSNATAGGVWTSSSTFIATVHSTAGVVTGVSGGVAHITYVIPTGCNAVHPVTVMATPLPISTTTGSLCVGSTLTVSCSTTGGTWSSSNPSVGSISPFGAVTGVSGGTCVIVYSLPSTGCSSTRQLNVFGASPSTYTVSGGGSYCSGGTGVTVGLNGSQTGCAYQLYRGSTAIGSLVWGTGSAISFGAQTVAGTYTVVANPGTSCSSTMSGSVAVAVNPLPVAYAVTGGGTYTGGSGIAIGLSGSQTGCNYQLMIGSTPVLSPLAGTGSAISFGLHTTAGVYTVLGINTTTGCVNMMSGSATISTTVSAFSVTGGGSYCSGGSGVTVGLSGSLSGVSYQLYNGTTPVGSSVTGTGSAISFGLQTVAGTYTVIATAGSSTTTMSGSATVVVNPLPVAYTVFGGGAFCSTGLPIVLSSSASGVTYRLYRGGTTLVSTMSGTGSVLNFPFQTVTGTYSVTGTSSAGCVSNMANTVAITAGSVPALFSVTGGGSMCTGGSGLPVGISGSQAGANYQLYNGATPVGSSVVGTGSAMSFGLFTTPGTYTVVANFSSSCMSTMSGSAVISVITTPAVYTVTGGGSFCSGASGVPVGLSNSQSGVSYQLYNGTTPVGSPVSGTGAAFTFGMQTAAGTYTVVANPGTSCSSAMGGSATVVVLPGPAAYAVTGGGVYCVGGTGVAVGISNSQTGVNYQLYKGGVATGGPLLGTGSAISFGFITVAGTYTVVANPGTACATTMTGSASVTVNSSPTSFPALISFGGGGGYCSGAAGAPITMPASAVGVNYQLFRGALPVGSPVPGIGTAFSFGPQPAGVYSVVATSTATGCSRSMTGSVTVTMYPLPAIFSVTGGGSYCSGGSGVPIGLGGSALGVSYRLYSGTTAVGAAVPGTGSSIAFGLQTVAGTYNVVATATSTACTAAMSGSAVVSVNSVNTYTVTGGGGYCSSGTGLVMGLTGSDAGVSYRLRLGTTLVGSPVSGTGGAISFSPQTALGTYTVVATNTAGCTGTMSGSAVISTGALPALFSVSGGGSYCSGGAGIAVGLTGTTTSVTYQLFSSGVASGAPVTGTGAPITFGLQTAAGTYTVMATNTVSGCTRAMSGLATVAVNPLPASYSVTGGGGYCSGGTGVAVGLSGSASGISYRLYRGTSYITAVSGGGSTLNFGLQTVSGTYTVVAYNTGTTCTSSMAGSAIVIVNPLPVISGSIYTVMPGASITLSGSPSGGIWSGSAPAIATVGSTSGVVTGVALGSATISYTLPTGCRATRSIGVTPTGFRSAPGSQEAVSSAPAILSVIPNPSRGIFTVKGAFPVSGDIPVRYTVTNMLGKVLFHAETIAIDGILNEEVDLGNVASGHYLLNVNTATERKTIGLLIE